MATGSARFQFLNNTSTTWNTLNPVLKDGELGFETDSSRMKIGNSQDTWNVSKYVSDMNVVTNTVTPIINGTNKMINFISIKDPGYEAIGDGNLHFLNEVVNGSPRFTSSSQANTYYGVSFITDITTQTVDWVAIQKAVNNINVKVFIPSGTYVLGGTDSITIHNVTNVNIYGVGYTSLITSSLIQNIIFLRACSNIVFTDIGLTTTYQNTPLLTGQEPVVKTNEQNITNVTFKRCLFSSPFSRSNGFAGNNTNVHRFTISVYFLECRFEDCGRMGIEFINHRDIPYEILYRNRNIVVDKCIFKNIGIFVNTVVESGSSHIIRGIHGMGISFSGYGMNCVVTNNIFENVQLSIEIIGHSNTTIAYNKFRNFPVPDASRPHIINGTPLRMTGEEGRFMYKNYIVGNVCEDSATTSAMVWLQRGSVMMNNHWRQRTTSSVSFDISRFDMRNNQDLWVYNDIFQTQDDNAIFLQDDSGIGTIFKLNFNAGDKFTILPRPAYVGDPGPYSTNGLAVGDIITIAVITAGGSVVNNGTYTITNIDTVNLIVTVSTNTFNTTLPPLDFRIRVHGKTSGIYFNNCIFDNSSNTRNSGSVFQSNGAISDNINISNSIFKRGSSTRAYYSSPLIANSRLNVFLSKDDSQKLMKDSTVAPIGNSWRRTFFSPGTSATTSLQVNLGTVTTTVPVVILLRISSVTTAGDRFAFIEQNYYYTHSSSGTLTQIGSPANIVSPSGITITPTVTGTSVSFAIQNTLSGSGTSYGFNVFTQINSSNVPIVTIS